MALFRGNGAHSRIVAWLKVGLPLAALGILSTLFLASRSIDPSDAIPYARVDIEDRIREPRMTLPSFSGVTADGASVTLNAVEARPDAGDGAGAIATGVTVAVTTPKGETTRINATTARFGATADTLDLTGGVQISTAAGMMLRTDTLTVATNRITITSGGTVNASGPLGQISAGKMMLIQDGQNGEYVLMFENGVKLVYQPGNTD